MEVGKLVTSSPAEAGRGSIFYFILDDEYPDDPRRGHQRYYYVVSDSPSYTDAYHFLCHSLCGKPASRSKAARVHLDRNSTQLRQWYQLYVRVFGPASYDAFVTSVAAAPWDTVHEKGKPPVSPAAHLPLLCTDEATARAALRACRRTESVATPPSPRSPTEHPPPSFPSHPAIPSCTPDRRPPSPRAHAAAVTVTAPTAATPVSTRHPRRGEGSAAMAPTSGSTRPNGATTGGLAHAPRGGAGVSNGVGTARPLDSRNFATPDPTMAPASTTTTDTSPTHRGARVQSPPAGADEGLAVVRELRALLAEVRGRAERETAALRRDLDDLRRTLTEERRSRDSLVHAAVEREDAERREAHARARRTSDAEAAATQKLRAAEAHATGLAEALAREREAAVQEVEKWQREVRQLHERLRTQSREHGERLHAIVKENQVAVGELDARVRAKEEEMRELYEDAVQSRDVRVTQLSESAMRAEHAARQAAAESADLRRKCAELERQLATALSVTAPVGPSVTERQLWEHNAALSREVAAARAELAHLRAAPAASSHELVQECARLQAECARLRSGKAAAELELVRAQERNAHQQVELERARHLIEALREGLETVQQELPVLRREIVPPTASSPARALIG